MQEFNAWESALHNHDRTTARNDHRYQSHRINLEPAELADPSEIEPDPGFQARVSEFLDTNQKLLDKYHRTAKGKKRRRLGRRILSALRGAELLSARLYRLLLRRGPLARARRLAAA